MTIKQKIIGKSLGTALLLAAVGVLSAVSMFRIGGTLRTIESTELRELRDADELEGAASRIDHIVDEYLAALQDHQQTDPARLKTEVGAALGEIGEATSQLRQTLFQPTDALRRSYDRTKVQDQRHLFELIEEQSRLLGDEWSRVNSRLGNEGDANSASLNRLMLTTGTLLRYSLNFERGAKDDVMHGVQAAQDRVTVSVRVLVVAAAVAITLSLILGLWVAMPLAARLARLRDGAVEIGRGNLHTGINDVGSGDEIGELGTAFNEMSAALRRSRDEIHNNESKFRELAEAIREVFWVAEADGSKVHYVSPAYEEIWGRTRESIYKDAMSFVEAVIPEDRPRVLGALKNMATHGMDEEYRIVRPDGAIRWIHDRGFAARSETGQVQRVVGIATDVTRQRTAEDALRQAHAELEQRVAARTAELEQANAALRASETDLQHSKDAAEAASRTISVVFDTALDAIVTIDSHSVITAWNLQAETLFRWDRTEAIGIRLDQTIFPQNHWDAHRREIEGFLKTGDGPLLNKVAELTAIRRDGREFPVELAITPAWFGDKCTFTAFIRDITQRKQAEADLRQARDAAETASRAKSEFLANMSHEIRTPLNGVIGMSDLLLETALDERQKRFAELIKSSGTSLADLINDILDFSKIEARKLEVESVDFDLYEVAENVTEMMLVKAAPKELELACLAMPDVPRHVKGDAQRIKQILINLVNNAIKFTESGSITTRLTMDDRSQDHVTVRFSVTDTGIGIPADRMDKLFKSFSQVDASTTRTYGGTGLGLAISKQLAELMGGAIGVESTVGHGSTFWFTVCLGLGSHVPTASIAPRGLRVLAAHASPTMREILRSQLSSWGLEADTASTGDQAMKMLMDATTSAHPFDVAILDGELPGPGALEIGKAIKARPEIAGTMLLILLPVESNVEPLALRAAGFSGHVIKPVRQSRLYDSIIDAMALPPRPLSAIAKTLPNAGNSSSRPIVPWQTARILVAEDNRVNQIVASEILAKNGYACDIVDNGRKAISAVSAGIYDLVLMDCSMPEVDGFEATRQIRLAEQANPATPRHMPIIALTANAINGDRERCLEAGMDEYVSKPIDSHRLIEAIQKVLAKPAPASPTPPLTVTQASAATSTSALAYDQAAPLAIDALFDRCMNNAETVALILEEFEHQAVADLAEIKGLVGGGDCAGTARVAHALKGAAGILSADVLSDIAFKLERMGCAGALTDTEFLLAQLSDEIRRCIDYLPTVRAAIAKRTQV